MFYNIISPAAKLQNILQSKIANFDSILSFLSNLSLNCVKMATKLGKFANCVEVKALRQRDF